MRVEDWEARLVAYLADVRDRPFRWGRHDCAVFADGVIEAVTGAPRFADCLSGYSSARGARRRLAALGFASLAEAASARLNPLAGWAEARRGDLVGVLGQDDLGLGVVIGRQAFVLGPAGLHLIEARRAAMAWAVD